MAESHHLKRLERVWVENAVYFVTACVDGRRGILAEAFVHEIIINEFHNLRDKHGWAIGRFVIMPDHVHFFTKPIPGHAKYLSKAMGHWKQWTAKRILKTTGERAPLWQSGFFDHVLRSGESRAEKWRYIVENPVRAGLVESAQDWPFAGHVDFR